MNLHHLSDDVLLSNTETAAAVERLATTALLHHLCEIQRRRLFAKVGCSSLFDYCVRVLKMSEPQAGRRVNAARLLQEFPQVENKINSGTLSLSGASQLQTFFNREAKTTAPLSLDVKVAILEKVENQSTRETEKILISHASTIETVRPDKLKAVTETLTEVRLTLNEKTMGELERLREVWSHSLAGASLSELIQHIASFCVKAVNPLLKNMVTGDKKENKVYRETAAGVKHAGEGHEDYDGSEKQRILTGSLNHCVPEAVELNVERNLSRIPRSRYISAALRQQVFMRDQGCCTYFDETTQRRCESRFRLQVDHIVPFAKGGPHSLENLRLRCFSHNQWHAMQTFGSNALKFRRELNRRSTRGFAGAGVETGVHVQSSLLEGLL